VLGGMRGMIGLFYETSILDELEVHHVVIKAANVVA